MRTILHCDLNNFYASVECLYRPDLRGKPVAVGGGTFSPEIQKADSSGRIQGIGEIQSLWCPRIRI